MPVPRSRTQPLVQRHPLGAAPALDGTRGIARDRPARASSGGPRCRESARDPASGRGGRRSAGETPRSPAPWSARCVRDARGACTPRARRRSSASTSGVSRSSAPSSPSAHARSSSVTAPGDDVAKASRTGSIARRAAPRRSDPGLSAGCSPCRPAFPHSIVRAACWPSREGTMTRTCRILTVGLIVMLGQAGVGRTASADEPLGFAGAGVESDLHRHAHRDEHGELLQPAARGDRSHGDLRRVQRHRTALHADLRSRPRSPRRVAPSGGHRGGVHRAGRPVPVAAGGARCPLRGFAGGAGRRWRRRRPVARARHRMGNLGRPGRARLARDRWLQRELPSIHRWDRGGPVAADTAGLRTHERPGAGIHRNVRPGRATPSSGPDHRGVWTAPRTRTISTPSRRSAARPDRRARRTRRRSLRSGRGTPASTGTRPPTRSRAPTTCPCPGATGCSRS